MPAEPRRKTIKVVLDTNVLVGLHKRLYGPEFTLLADFLATQPSVLVVPEIVFQEAVNKFRERAEKALVGARKSIANLDDHLLTPSGCDLLAVDIDKATKKYAQKLRARLSELGAADPSYSDIPHADLVSRDLARCKPFRESGRGYRDALVWETVLRHVVEKSAQTVLITNDMDFSEGKPPTLHSDLQRDLMRQGLPCDAAILSSTLQAFNDEYVKPLLPKAAVIAAAMQEGHYKQFAVKAFFEEQFDEIRDQINELLENAGQELSAALPGMPDLPETISVDMMGEPDNIYVLECYELDDGNVLVEIAVRLIDNELGFYIWKADVYGIPEAAGIAIDEFDWNKHYSQASVCAQLDVTLNVVLNPSDGTVKGWEISNATFVEEWPDEGEVGD